MTDLHQDEPDLFSVTKAHVASAAHRRACASTPTPSSEPEVGIVIRFPIKTWAPGLWRQKVENVARILRQRKTEVGRQKFWRNTVNTLARQMQQRGATLGEIEDEIGEFHIAVSEALDRQGSGLGSAL